MGLSAVQTTVRAAIAPETAGIAAKAQLAIAAADLRADDNRDDLLKSLDGADVYRFPRASRREMIEQILGRKVWVEAAGLRHIGWDVRMNFKWDSSGRVDGGEELCASQDERWQDALDENDAILRRAAEAAMEPYLDPEFRILGGDEEMACQLEVVGANHGFVLMRSMAGRDMGFADAASARAALEDLDDAEVRDLWAACRVLDVDFSRANRVFEMSWHLNAIRAEMEADWLEELEPELDF
jgi:hypothetical protein